MIGAVIAHLRDVLDAALHAELPDGAADGVVLPDPSRPGTDPFQPGAVTLLVVNVEEDRLLRPANPYERRTDNGVATIAPDLRIDVQLLFVARLANYDDSWTALSALLRYFQTHPVLDRTSQPSLPDGVERLVFALRTLDLAEQSRLWEVLRVPYAPSLSYRMSLLRLQDAAPAPAPPVTDRSLDLSQISGGTS